MAQIDIQVFSKVQYIVEFLSGFWDYLDLYVGFAVENFGVSQCPCSL